MKYKKSNPNVVLSSFILCFLFCTLRLLAQGNAAYEFPYIVGEPYKSFHFDDKFYFTKGNESLSLKIHGDQTMVQKYDNLKATCIKANKYDLFFPGGFLIEAMVETGGKYYFFYSKKIDSHDGLYFVEVDFDTATLVGMPKLLIDIDGKVVAMRKDPAFMGTTKMDEYKFNISQSFNQEKTLIHYRKKPEEGNDKKSFEVVGLQVFDSNLTTLDKKEIRMPYTERRMHELDHQIDNMGNFYLLAKVFNDDSGDDKKSKQDQIANYHVELLTIAPGSNNIKISKFENKEKFINRLWLYDTPHGYLECGGLYSTGKDLRTKAFFSSKSAFIDDSDGIVVFKIHSDGSITDEHTYEIPLSLIKAYERKKDLKKIAEKESEGGAKMPYLELRNIEVLPEGGMIIIAEQFYTETTGGGYNINVEYSYGSLLVSRINPDGSLLWMKKIPKHQTHDIGLGSNSFKYFAANGNHYFVFIDNFENINLTEDQAPRIADFDMMAVMLSDAAGNTKKGIIYNMRKVEEAKLYKFAADRIIKTSENTFMIESYKKQKKDILVKFTLD